MKDRTPRPDPERLVRDPEIGALLERANAAYRGGLDESGAFRRVSANLEPRRSGGWRRAGAGAVICFAAAAAIALVVTREERQSVAFGPEVARPRAMQLAEPSQRAANPLEAPLDMAEKQAKIERDGRHDGPREAQPTVADDLEAAPDPRDGAERNLRSEPARGREARNLEAPRGVEPDGGSSADKLSGTNGISNRDRVRIEPPSVGSAVGGRADCLDLAHQGDPRGAERCFGDRASGAGLSAEMALYEMARLRRDVLRDENGALSALDDYRQRFPHGSLRHEVNISRVELLFNLGRGREALSESEALLATPSGRERAAELHMLRGNAFRRDLDDWRSASAEYAEAEALGGALSAEATRLRGMSLEALGDTDGALAAYRRYLAGADAPRRTEVARRVEMLSAGPRANKP